MLNMDIADKILGGLGLDGDQISPSVFPLPGLGKTLRTLTADLHTKQPFFILRGLSLGGLAPEDTVLRYLGVASFVADKIGAQEACGNVFGKMPRPHTTFSHSCVLYTWLIRVVRSAHP
jgi:hypothetical protein